MGLARVRPDSEFSCRNSKGGAGVFPLAATTLLVLSALGPAHLPIGFFLKSHMGRSTPAWLLSGLFLFSFMIFFNYYLRGLGFLALILSPPFKDAQKEKSACMEAVSCFDQCFHLASD